MTLTNPRPAFSRRAFFGAAALASAAVWPGGTAAFADGIDRRWAVARTLIASEAIGAVRYASAVVPAGRRGAARRQRLGQWVPAEVAETLDGLRYALGAACALDVRTAEHAATGSFSLTCELDGGRRIAIAAGSGDFSATARGTAGSLHIAADTIAVESNGRWQEVRL